MRAKTIIIIVVTILVTIVLMKNTDEVNFWIFGNQSVPKLAVLGVMFLVGFILGYLAGRPRKKIHQEPDQEPESSSSPYPLNTNQQQWIDPKDNDYIN